MLLKKKYIKYIIRIFILLIFVFVIILNIVDSKVFAESETSTITTQKSSKMSINDFWSAGWGFINHGEAQESQIYMTSFSKQIIPIIQFIVIIALISLVIAILVLGIKYMLIATTEKAELKKKLGTLVLATIIIAGSYTIWSVVYNFLAKVTSE